MFKVVIVDDEVYVVALIQKLIDWEKFQMKVEATAGDGMTALELVRNIKPELVIVDVRMPGYDGISFMDQVRKFNTNVKFIVISGHKQFDYARGAMRNNVEDYLLKPINKEELETVIGRVYNGLMENRQKESRMQAMEEELDTSKRRIRESFVEVVLKGADKEIGSDLEKINERFLTDFRPGIFQMLALVLDVPTSLESSQENDLMLKGVQQNLREKMRGICQDVLELEYRNFVLFFLNYEEAQAEKLKGILREQMAECNRQVKKFENLFFGICLGDVCKEMKELERTTCSMWKCVLCRTSIGGGKIIELADIHESEDILPVIMEYREEKLSRAMSALNAEEITRCIKEMYSKAFYGIEEDSLLYYKLYVELMDRIYEYFSNIGICEEEEGAFKQRFLWNYIQAPNSGEYARILYKEVRRMIEEKQLSGKSQVTPTIRIIKRYITEHYQEDISLSSAAKLVNISPVYLSRLFKKEEGINFLDYLNQYRIDVSKKLLQDVKYNVIEVAEQSGFHNTRYFSKIFKKVVGITPSEYRKRHSGKDE